MKKKKIIGIVLMVIFTAAARTVVVQGSCKIHRALYDRLTETLEELKRIEAGSGVDPDLLEIIQTITQIVDNLYIK